MFQESSGALTKVRNHRLSPFQLRSSHSKPCKVCSLDACRDLRAHIRGAYDGLSSSDMALREDMGLRYCEAVADY